LARIQGGLPWPEYNMVWLEYKEDYIGQNTILTFDGVQGSLPWPEHKTVYLCQTTICFAFAGIQGSLPWIEYQTVYLGQNTICFTFAGVQGSLPWIEHKTVNLCQNHNILYLCWNTRQFTLKVVGNEKLGGSGGWLLFKDGTGLWRSMSVCFLMLPSFFLQSISVSCL
jgi:hypothetical protein